MRQTLKDPWGRRARGIAELQEFDFKKEFIDGCDNLVADALLKSPGVRKCQSDSLDGAAASWSSEVFCKAQNEDPLLQLDRQSLLGETGTVLLQRLQSSVALRVMIYCFHRME